MSVPKRAADRQILTRLLELSQQQVKALEADDMPRFDAILAEKSALTDSLYHGRGPVSAEGNVLQSVVSRIQDADKAAEALLYQKVGQVMREMNRVTQQEKARGTYGQQKSRAARPIGFLPDTPTFVDVRS